MREQLHGLSFWLDLNHDTYSSTMFISPLLKTPRLDSFFQMCEHWQNVYEDNIFVNKLSREMVSLSSEVIWAHHSFRKLWTIFLCICIIYSHWIYLLYYCQGNTFCSSSELDFVSIILTLSFFPKSLINMLGRMSHSNLLVELHSRMTNDHLSYVFYFLSFIQFFVRELMLKFTSIWPF